MILTMPRPPACSPKLHVAACPVCWSLKSKSWGEGWLDGQLRRLVWTKWYLPPPCSYLEALAPSVVVFRGRAWGYN